MDVQRVKRMSELSNNTNILLVGKTGVGKSSMINYIYDKPGMCPTGDGKPVTSFGIHKIPSFRYRNMQISPFDSSGLEGGDNVRLWKEMLDQEIRKNNALEVKDWFHTIVYCISAEAGRIDSFEEGFISDIVDSGNKVIFALTKSDTVSWDRRQILRNIIAEKFGSHSAVEICNVEKKMRGGRSVSPFGRDDMLRTICRNFRSNLIFKVIRLEEQRMESAISDFHRSVMKDFDGSVSFFTSFDDKFKTEREDYFRRQYKLLVMNILDRLGEQIREIDRITRDVLENYCAISFDDYNSGFRIDDILDFSRWKTDCSFWHSVSSPFRRSTEYRSIIAGELIKVKADFRERMKVVFDDIRSNSEENRSRTDFLFGYDGQ